MTRRPKVHDDRSRRFPVAMLGLAAVALIVLHSPADVVSALTFLRTERTEPGGTSLDSVADVGIDAAAPVGEAAGAPVATDGGRASDAGRWGASDTRPTTALILEELRATWRVEGGIEEAVALAVIAAHRWAAEEGIGVGTGGGGGAIVAVEAVEHPGAHHGVVTLIVASDTAIERIAVPVRLDAGSPALAGTAWRLPAPDMRTVEMEGTAIGDAELLSAARRALEHVGVPGERLRALEVTDGWPFIARLDDGESDRWLRWHVDRFVVAGLPLESAGDR